jgi:hypothetical protein
MSWKGKKKRGPGSGKMRRTISAAGGTLDGRPVVLLVIGTEQAVLNADDWDTTKNHIDGLFRVALLKGGIV